jgi:hypothetical protein
MASPVEQERDPWLESLTARVATRLWRTSSGPCLERSVALYRVLGREGATPTLVCGMGRAGDSLVGHAWVEVDGLPIVDRGDPNGSFAALVRYRANGERLVD